MADDIVASTGIDLDELERMANAAAQAGEAMKIDPAAILELINRAREQEEEGDDDDDEAWDDVPVPPPVSPKLSSGARSLAMEGRSLSSIFDNAEFRLFSGPEPENADAPESGELLCVMSRDGTGDPISFGADIFEKALGSNCFGKSLVTSATELGYFRLVDRADDGGSSSEFPRIQGSAGGQHSNAILKFEGGGLVYPGTTINLWFFRIEMGV